MSIAARFSAPQAQDRRAGENRTRLKLLSGIAGNSGPKSDAMVLNISATGLLLQASQELSVGQRITVEIPMAGDCAAEVVWCSDNLFGCRFIAPLGKGVLSAAQLRSMPETNEDAEPPMLADYGQAGSPFGTRLARLRRARGLTQTGFAKAVGVSKTTVWKWENGKAKPRRNAISMMLEILNVTRAELMTGPLTNSAEDDQGVAGQANTLTVAIRESKLRVARAAGITPEQVAITLAL